MNTNDDVREFLMSRRANVTPEQAGLPDFGGERRVAGLRREEVAMLAGVSLDYYTRLERGKIHGASESVLNAIATALHLDDVERAHLFDLARAVPPTPATRRPPTSPRTIRPSVQRVLDHMAVPAVVYNARQDLVASNLLGRALFAPHFEADPPNNARFIFLDSRARDYYDDWPLACSLTAAMLRYEAGRDPLNSDLTALIGELSTRSPQFRKNWAEQDVHEHRTGTKIYRHPAIGPLELHYDVFEMPGEPGLSIGTYTAEAGTAAADGLTLLATWATTQEFARSQRLGGGDASSESSTETAAAPRTSST
ncbi:helix-turn-helix transcriptional regulator [Agromyces albus]|uniref:XRE family transcriptional regulator n=1 Tax=Agromyces albus TaxID=205332 RepID=A0A4Q2L373_9MICO|nr:helix-turn-helix transcriptional regulator [Agromyces albus]RXZ70752.1 XRE family transcriptional regulator [Agromyces albus]